MFPVCFETPEPCGGLGVADPMRPSMYVLGCLLEACFAMSGCSKHASADGSPAPSVSAAVPPNLAGYCVSICRRAAECGAARADKLGSADPTRERGAQDEAHREAPELARSCADRCAVDAPSGELAQKLIRAERCVEQDSCDTFGACLRDAAGLIGPKGVDPG